MDIIELEKGEYTVAAIADTAGGTLSSPVLDFLEQLPGDLQASAAGFGPLFERYAQLGRRGVTTANFHEANKEEGIWEFIKGRIRIYCFKDPSKKSLVLLTNGAIKKTQRAHRADIKAAIKARDEYLLAASQQTLVIHEMDSN